jgi:Tol biopolymer transport system component
MTFNIDHQCRTLFANSIKSSDWLKLAFMSMAIILSPNILFAADKDGAKKPGLPLEGTTEKLTFETDEGTWMSLDVTPDGQQIVFELLGDIYQMPIEGGAAARITSGMDYDSMPRVSPDGQWITFISDRDGDDNLWVTKRDGTEPRKLSDEKYSRLVTPTWTPDSQYIAVTTGGRKVAIKMFHVNGGKGLTLESDDKTNPANGVGLSFSPNGKHLYFTERPRGRAAFPAGQIVRFNRETGEIDSITQGEGGGIKPMVSPDGTTLVYLSRYETETGIRVRNLITGADRMLVWPIQRDAQEIGRLPSRDYYPNYDFTPDGSALILHTGGKIQRISMTDGAMSVIPFNATVDLEIGPDLTTPYQIDQGPVQARIVQDPMHSPDGQTIAASVLTKIYLMDNTTDATPKRLTKSNAWEFKPVWSPDGRWIAYVTWSMNDGGHIWKIRSNGRGKPEKLTKHPAFYTDLIFTPDGKRIVAMRGNEYMRHQTFSEFTGLGIPLDLVWLPINGGDTRLIASSNGARGPHFGPDANRIYLYSGDALESIRFDGTDRRDHLIVELPRGSRGGGDKPPRANSIRISPDGNHALVWGLKQLWAMPVPKIGAKTPTISVRQAAVPAVQLTNIGADSFGWTDGGKTITWAIGQTVYTRPFDSLEFLKSDKDTDDGDKDDSDTEETKQSENDTSDAESINSKTNETFEKTPEFLDYYETVTALAFNVEMPRKTPEGTILLKGGNLITMKGATTAEMASVHEKQDILVTNNHITAMGPSGSLTVPDDTTVVDATGKYITPGFIDTHAHWEFRTGGVIEPQNWTLVANLAYGVTAGLDVQTNYEDYFAYRDMVDTGQSVGQRAFTTGPGIFGNNDFKSYEAVLAYLKRYSDHYQTKNIKSYLVGNRKQRQWVVKASKELGLMPTTEGGGDMRLNITHAIDGMHGNEHTLTIAPLYKDVLEVYAKTQTAYTPTLIVQYNGVSMVNYFFTRTEVHDDPKLNRFYPHNRLDEMARRRSNWVRDDEFSVDHIASAAADLQRAGGLVGVGGHGEVQGLGYHWEMWALAMGGMTPAEVLRAATIDGAKIIGINQDLGSLEPGKLADLVVLNANPLDNIRNTNTTHLVMKNGELYEADTLTQVWPVKKELTPFWWWDKSRH